MKMIWLTKGQFTLVDDLDYEFLNQWKWCVHKDKNRVMYAIRGQYNKETGKVKSIKMHRVILGLTDSKIEGEHIDNNGLNNQRYNLRTATRSQNNSNKSSAKNSSSKYLGVGWHKAHGKWQAKIWKTDRRYHIGYFDNEDQAALAYNNKAVELHGEFANLNTIQ